VAENKLTRKEQAEQTKRHIFESALKLLELREFDDITIRDIVKAAGVSVGSFYNYYKSKLDVYYETYQLADEYFEEKVAPLLTQETAGDRILCFFDYYARYSSEFTSLALTKILYNSDNKWFERKTGIGMRPILTRTLQYGLDKGEFRSDSTVDEIANFLLIAVRGLVYNWCTLDGSYDLRDATRRYVATLLRCIK
jgi:TetR/AcrR family fatty acid metabolism transcriptional regulator